VGLAITLAYLITRKLFIECGASILRIINVDGVVNLKGIYILFKSKCHRP
jgi:hypothetical protein